MSVRQPVHSPQHAASYYAASANPHASYPTLGGELRADVCIIGGGFSGLNTAIELAERGLSVILLEAHLIGWGASGRNGGQLIRGVGHGLEQFENLVGSDGVREFKLMGLEAVEIVRRRVDKYQIDCDLTWGYCDLANKPSDYADFAEDAAELRSLGYQHELRMVAPTEMASVVQGTVMEERPSSRATNGANATTMMASFNATWLRVKAASPRHRLLHTNTIAVHGAAASRMRPAT